jgi:hypothetical protein
MRARWRLGQLLSEIERGAGPGRSKKGGDGRPYLKGYLLEIGLKETTAKEAQRIGALPESDLAKALARARERDTLLHFADLIILARRGGTRPLARRSTGISTTSRRPRRSRRRSVRWRYSMSIRQQNSIPSARRVSYARRTSTMKR